MNAGDRSLPLELVWMRASQINGCSVCVDMHGRSLKKAVETDERIFAIAAWREAPTSPTPSARHWRSAKR